MARRMALAGCNSIVLDLDYGFDILNPAHFDALIWFCEHRKVLGVGIAHPCESFSKARRAPAWSKMPHQLRSREFVMGLASLEGKDLAACELGNNNLAATMKLIRTLRRLHIPFFVESPRGSYLWETPALKRLLQSPDMTQV